MRQVAVVSEPVGEVRRVMVYDTGDTGVYLFLYRSHEDGPCFADHWFESAAEAIETAEQDLGVRSGEWRVIPDPRTGCQHDWEAPVRVKRGADGVPLWGQFEPAPE